MSFTVSSTEGFSRLLEGLARVTPVPLPDESFEPLRSGTTVGRFVVEREIGRGGFGVVYAAHDPELNRPVAIKLLRPGVGLAHTGTDWIRAEAEALGRLAHPAIVTVFDAGRSELGAFLVFELLEGESLDVRLTRGDLATSDVLRIANVVTGALDHAHAAGVLHRDLKPANVFLTSDGAVKVLDFGIAQVLDRAGVPGSGTPGYMAPEQRDGKLEDERSDLYALGALIEAMITAATKGRRNGVGFGRRRAIERLARWLRQDDPDRRPASAAAVLRRIDAIRETRRRMGVAAALTSVAALLLGLLTLAKGHWQHEYEAPPGESLLVAIAPVRNESGEGALDSLHELVRAGLADSRRLKPVAQTRMASAVRRLGRATKALDENAWRRAAGGIGAAASIQTVARREPDGFVVALTARDVRTDEVLFDAEARAPTLDALSGSIDTAVKSLRRRAGERSADLARFPRLASELATASIRAHAAYAKGVDCARHVGEGSGADVHVRCGIFLRRALEADPAYSMAKLQLGQILVRSDRGSAEGIRLIEESLSAPQRLSERDRELAEAVREYLGGAPDAAVRRYAALVAGNPGDVDASYLAGDVLFHESRYAEAAPYLARLADMEDELPIAFDHLVESYALSGQTAALSRLLETDAAPHASTVQSVVRGELWLGHPDRAIDLARAAGAEMSPGAARRLLYQALVASGRIDEAGAVASALLRDEPTNQAGLVYEMSIATRQGRVSDAWQLLASPPPTIQGLSGYELAVYKATLAAAERNLPRLRREVEKLASGPRDYLKVVAPQLALLGTSADADAAAKMLPPGTIAAQEVEALRAWKRGNAPLAVSSLVRLEQTAPRPNDALSPAYLLAEVARETDPSEALAAAERFRMRIPIGPAAVWAHGRSLMVSAEAAWRLGQREAALDHLARVDRLLVRADRDHPLLREAQRLRKAIDARVRPSTRGEFGPT